MKNNYREINYLKTVFLIHDFKKGYEITERYDRIKNTETWKINYSTDHCVRICPVYGDFRKCQKCRFFVDEINDSGDTIKVCNTDFTIVSTNLVEERIKMCRKNKTSRVKTIESEEK